MATTATRPRAPRPPGPLVGRAEELASAVALMLDPEARLVTLTGAPGIGKTRLALAIAEETQHHFAQGVRFVDLSQVGDASLVWRAVANAVAGAIEGGEADLPRLSRHLSDQQTLLILDNFEQVVDAASDVARLLEACEYLKVLVTSRAPLRIRWERQFPVPPLSLPPDHPARGDVLKCSAATLFVDRARAVAPHLNFGDNDESTLAELCIRLEGVPLAIELAAARARSFTLRGILSRLASRLDFLDAGPRDLPHRQRTLRGAIGWSYGLLGEREQAVFRGLGAFTGGFEPDAAASVCGFGEEAAGEFEGLLECLIDSSLVHAVDVDGPVRRFKMLEAVREYALECLEASGEGPVVRERHALYYQRLAAGLQEALGGPQQAVWLARLAADEGNLRSAFLYWDGAGEPERTAEMMVGLWRFWWMHGSLTEGREYAMALLSRSEAGAAPDARVAALFVEGCLATWQASYGEAEAALICAVNEARVLALPDIVAYGLTFLCRVARDLGREGAAALGEEAVALFRESGDRWGLGLALHFTGLAAIHENWMLAKTLFEESAATFRGLEVPGDLAMPLRGLGVMAYQDGDLPGARAYLEESLVNFRGRGDEWSGAMVSHDLGYVAYAQGQLAEAAARLGESLRAWRRVENQRGQITAIAGAAGVIAAIGDGAEAASLLGTVHAVTRRRGIVLEPTDVSTIERIELAAREKVGNRSFAEAQRRGRLIDLDTASSRAMELLEIGPPEATRTSGGAATEDLSVLTPREREVAACVRHGMTNRQIAERLGISEGTAGIHVKHILAKLDFGSRAQVAAWAAVRGLHVESPAR